MPTFILPNALDANGDPVNGALAKVYLADGTTPATTYSDEAMSSANAWPIVYSAAGTPGACYVAEGEYKLDLQTSAGVSLDGYPKDDIAVFAFPIGLATGGTGTTTGPTLPTRTILTTGTAQTYTTPSGCRMILVRCQGASGGSGGVAGAGAGTAAIGGGGGPGGYCEKLITSPAATFTYTVGAGGAGATSGANNGSDATDTTFSDGVGVSLTAEGGGGGGGDTGTSGSGFAGTPGTVGSASGGDINVDGVPSPANYILSGVNVSGGARGSPSRYGAATQKTANGAGSSATGYGASPTGAYASATGSSFAGADGQGGIIEIWEFY